MTLLATMVLKPPKPRVVPGVIGPRDVVDAAVDALALGIVDASLLQEAIAGRLGLGPDRVRVTWIPGWVSTTAQPKLEIRLDTTFLTLERNAHGWYWAS